MPALTKMKLPVIVLSASLLYLCCLASAHAGGSQDLTRFFNDVNSYSARFEQQVLDENRQLLDASSGEFWIERPGRFRWEYQAPSPQIIVGTHDTIWIHDVELEQVTRRNSIDAIAGTPAALLAGKGNIDESFTLTELGRRDGLDWVRMQPRKKDAGFVAIRVGFENGLLRRLELVDSFDQTTRMYFTEIHENIDIPAETFSFTPPAGIDVIEE